MSKTRKYFLFIVVFTLLLCAECTRRFASDFTLPDNHLEQVRSFLAENQDELEKMIDLLQNNPDISEGADFPFASRIKPHSVGEQKFSDDFPRSSRAGFKLLAVYNSCLILSDMKRGLATQLLYCSRYNGALPIGEYRNGYRITNSLGNKWHLLTYDDYIFGTEKGFDYPVQAQRQGMQE